MIIQNTEETNTYIVQPIGTVHRPENGYCLHIAPPYRAGLKQLEHFSHVIVLWWADRQATPESRSQMTCYPPYAPDKLTGVFATRAEYRPNPIGLTVCEIITLDEANGIIQVRNVDAFEGTPILDLKGYFPVCDRVKGAHIPDWLDWGWIGCLKKAWVCMKNMRRRRPPDPLSPASRWLRKLPTTGRAFVILGAIKGWMAQ